MSKRPRKAKPGTCRACGCTDDHACDEGCYWVDPGHTMCSACAWVHACPICKAKPGAPCMVVTGGKRRTGVVHRARYAEAA